MILIRAFQALYRGISCCLLVKPVRKLAIRPWIIGFFSYPLSLLAVIQVHPMLMRWIFTEAPEGVWKSALFYLAWLLFALLLLVLAGLFGLLLVIVLASVFQTAIARLVLQLQGISVPEEDDSIKGTFKETMRTISVEISKLLWLVPVLLALLLAGFIPLLSPLAFAAGSWVLGYQFIDTVLDIYRVPVWRRLRFAIDKLVPVTCFGMTLAVCWLIPFMGIVLPPAAAAGAAWLLSEGKLLEPFVSKEVD